MTPPITSPKCAVPDAQLVTALADLAESQPESKHAAHLVGPARALAKRLARDTERERVEE